MLADNTVTVRVSNMVNPLPETTHEFEFEWHDNVLRVQRELVKNELGLPLDKFGVSNFRLSEDFLAIYLEKETANGVRMRECNESELLRNLVKESLSDSANNSTAASDGFRPHEIELRWYLTKPDVNPLRLRMNMDGQERFMSWLLENEEEFVLYMHLLPQTYLANRWSDDSYLKFSIDWDRIEHDRTLAKLTQLVANSLETNIPDFASNCNRTGVTQAPLQKETQINSEARFRYYTRIVDLLEYVFTLRDGKGMSDEDLEGPVGADAAARLCYNAITKTVNECVFLANDLTPEIIERTVAFLTLLQELVELAISYVPEQFVAREIAREIVQVLKERMAYPSQSDIAEKLTVYREEVLHEGRGNGNFRMTRLHKEILPLTHAPHAMLLQQKRSFWRCCRRRSQSKIKLLATESDWPFNEEHFQIAQKLVDKLEEGMVLETREKQSEGGEEANQIASVECGFESDFLSGSEESGFE